MSEVVLQAQGLHKRYTERGGDEPLDVPVLQGVDLEVRRGETVQTDIAVKLRGLAQFLDLRLVFHADLFEKRGRTLLLLVGLRTLREGEAQTRLASQIRFAKHAIAFKIPDGEFKFIRLLGAIGHN